MYVYSLMLLYRGLSAEILKEDKYINYAYAYTWYVIKNQTLISHCSDGGDK